MMRETVSLERLTSLVSRRYVAMNIAIGVSTFMFGFWLTTADFPLNYQIMFIFTFILTLISLWHIRQMRSLFIEPHPTMHPAARQIWQYAPFREVGSIAFLMHITFFFAFPFVPVYLVNNHGVDEQFMSLFVVAELIASTATAFMTPNIARRIGHRAMIAPGLVGTAISTLIVPLVHTPDLTLLAAAINGAGWTMANVGLFGFFNERIPTGQATPFTTYYNQIIFLGMFIGPLIGSGLVGQQLDIVTLLIVGSGLRLLASVVASVDFGYHQDARANVLYRM